MILFECEPFGKTYFKTNRVPWGWIDGEIGNDLIDGGGGDIDVAGADCEVQLDVP